jgi:hypothetical protein
LPRTNAEYDLSELALKVGSPDQESSQLGVGSEGVEENQPDARSENREGEQSGAATAERAEKTDKSQTDDKSRSEQKSQSEGNDESEKKPSEKSSSEKAEPEKKSAEKTSSEQKSQEKSPAEKTPPENQPSEKSSSQETQPKDADTKKKPEEKKQPGGGQKSSQSMPRPSIPRLTSVAGITWLLTLLKWIFYGILAIIVIYAIWRNREALWKGFCDFVQFFTDLWQNLFGGARRRAEAAAEAANAKKLLPRFADFTDPFAAGVAGRYPPAELVRYTFEALEAWARDRGLARHPDQTPHEFVRDLAADSTALGDDAAQLADLYSQVAYAPFTLPAGSAARLSQLWRIMRAEAVSAAAASGAERQSH